MGHSDALTAYIAAFVDELVSAGVTDCVVSPGSRSTPIAMVMAEHPKLKVTVHIDERSAAFFALGLAKQKQKAVALLCTSGTAAANYYPAIVEAHYSHIPLIVLTADRPHELRDVGAPQAIDQLHLYGRYAKWFAEMAIPEQSDSMLRYVRTMAARAVGVATSAPVAPVHLNFPLREPLVPNVTKESFHQGKREAKFVDVWEGYPMLPEGQYDELAAILHNYTRGIIVCGEQYDRQFPAQVVKLSKALQFPILADPLSQLRSGPDAEENVVDSYDSFLRMERVKESLKPEVIIRFGAMPVSKALTQFITSLGAVEHYVIDGNHTWREPTQQATKMIACEEKAFCLNLLTRLKTRNSSPWLMQWMEVNEYAKQEMRKAKEEEELFEGKIFQELTDLMPNSSTLFVGNSMPIRDCDSFFFVNNKSITVLCNRGANGIDGVVSSALGASMNANHLVLVIGDLSFYHDLNGLLAGKLLPLQATIVVVNNNGGGIFSFLPQANHPTHFESLFGTPTDLQFEDAAKLYGCAYQRISNWEEFRQAVDQSFSYQGVTIVEVPSNRDINVTKHRMLWNRVSQEIENQWSVRE